jgi:hypothetical protein
MQMVPARCQVSPQGTGVKKPRKQGFFLKGID